MRDCEQPDKKLPGRPGKGSMMIICSLSENHPEMKNRLTEPSGTATLNQ